MAMNNSLAEVHPELVSEWSEKNLPLTPDDITFGSNKKVWWKGACGHEWQTSVKVRSSGEKCPICSGARVIAGINDLATLEPLLVKQGNGDRYAIYHVDEDTPGKQHLFMNMAMVKEDGITIDAANYKCVYSGRLYENERLDDLYAIFNDNPPADYKAHLCDLDITLSA